MRFEQVFQVVNHGILKTEAPDRSRAHLPEIGMGNGQHHAGIALLLRGRDQ